MISYCRRKDNGEGFPKVAKSMDSCWVGANQSSFIVCCRPEIEKILFIDYRWGILTYLKFLTIPLVAKNNLFLYFPSERSIDSVWKSYFEWFGQRSDPEHSLLTRVDTSNLGPEPANMDLETEAQFYETNEIKT